MQINTIHEPEIARVTGVSREQAHRLLRDDGCFNVAVGSMLLWKRKREAGGDLLEGMGAYHSWTPKRKSIYQGLFRDRAKRIFEPHEAAKAGDR